MPGFDWLANLRVLDLTTEMGALGVRVLSEYGAHVTRIEPPAGDPLRLQPPFAASDSGERLSLYWVHMMRGRDCRTLDLDLRAGREAFHELAAASDVVFESQPAGWFADQGIDVDAVLAANPRLVWVSVTPFGRSGPRAGWQATDLIGMAAGGLLSLCGDRDLPPLRVSVEQAYAQAGLQALAGLVVALRGVRQGRPGQLVDVSMQAAVANCLGNARLFHEVEGVPTLRAGGGRATGTQGSRLVYPCADGYVSFARMPDSLHALTDWMHEEGVEPGFDAERLAALPQAGRHMAPPELTNAFDAAVEKLFGKADEGHHLRGRPASRAHDLPRLEPGGTCSGKLATRVSTLLARRACARAGAHRDPPLAAREASHGAASALRRTGAATHSRQRPPL